MSEFVSDAERELSETQSRLDSLRTVHQQFYGDQRMGDDDRILGLEEAVRAAEVKVARQRVPLLDVQVVEVA